MQYIPFITSPRALQLVKTIYANAAVMRVPLDMAPRLTAPSEFKLWIDPGVDGLDNLEARRPREDKNDSKKKISTAWYDGMKGIRGFERISDVAFMEKPVQKVVKEFVVTILDRCLAYKPSLVTVPQLPFVYDASRNKINRALAKATGEWRASREFSGRLILPVIITHQSQTHAKVDRNKKVGQAGRNYHDAHADGVWVVDQSFSDESGSKGLRGARFTSLIQFHQELNDEISSRIRIAGPYWGLNLVLWARGLIEYPAIGVGSTYHYNLSGNHKSGSTPASRVALGPLRRRAIGSHLRPWLEKTLRKIDSRHPAYADLEAVQKRLTFLADYERAREQVARFYKSWLDVLAATPPSGRSLALFQDLSTAYAIGKSLLDIPDEGPARRPESIAEPLMLNCL